jgi:hypothetical protein
VRGFLVISFPASCCAHAESPHIFIDSSFPFADDFAIVLGPNIITALVSAASEPAPALLLGPVAFGFGLAPRRRAMRDNPTP